jgi:hypothetical protein
MYLKLDSCFIREPKRQHNLGWPGTLPLIFSPLAFCSYMRFQGFGNHFESDGRLKGDLNVQTVNCANNVCQVQVPAPGFALVFLSDAAFEESTQEAQTFATTAVTRTRNTATVDQAVLATSNGWWHGNQKDLGSTSKQSSAGRVFVPYAMASIAALGAIFVRRQMR